MMTTYGFVVNARIGTKKINRLQTAVLQYLQPNQYVLEITEYGGHASVIAKKFLQEGIAIIVAVGGDGTVNEVIQVLAGTRAVLGIIPTGSGNGLARHCQIPLQIDKAVATLVQAHPLCIDLGKVNDIYFISNAGVGFDAEVCHTIKSSNSRGLKMYVRKVVRHFFSYVPATYTIQTDNETFTQKAFFINVANGREFGYGFEIAPQATLQDGLLDVIIVKSMSLRNSFSFIWAGWRKKLIVNNQCLYQRTKKISIKSTHLNYFQTDGDAHPCQGICTFEVCENALSIAVPPHVHEL